MFLLNLVWGLIELVGVKSMLCPDEVLTSTLQKAAPLGSYPLRCPPTPTPPPQGSNIYTPGHWGGPVVRAGRGETRPPWRGQQGPCPDHLACEGHQASAGLFWDHPVGTGSRRQSWYLWTTSQSGPWAGWGVTPRSLSRGKTEHLKKYHYCYISYLSLRFLRGGGKDRLLKWEKIWLAPRRDWMFCTFCQSHDILIAHSRQQRAASVHKQLKGTILLHTIWMCLFIYRFIMCCILRKVIVDCMKPRSGWCVWTGKLST